jgi:ABC-type multidrug transport system fused ATPase/permease subunit
MRLWRHLNWRRRRQFGLLLGLMIVSACAEVISLGAVLPFLAVLAAPDRVFNHPIFADVVQAWGITSADQLVLPLTVAFATAAVLAGALRILLLWVSTMIAFASGSDLGIEVYRRTLYQPYRVHVARNSSEVISGITNKVGASVNVLHQLLSLTSSTVMLVAIMLALIAINPMVASAAVVGVGVSYALIILMSRRKLHINSQRIPYEQTQVVKALQEGLGGIRDVLLDGTQQFYCDIYSKADHPLRRAQGNNIFISGSPRFAMEAMGIVLIAALAYVLSLKAGGIATALPVLGALALGSQRLLPALQQIFSAWASIAGSHASLADTLELLDQPLPAEELQPTSYRPDASTSSALSPSYVSPQFSLQDLQTPVPSLTALAPLPFSNAIRFDAVRFRYTDDGPWVLDGLNLTIPRGATIGFVGSTGSGKSTTIDLLMGLLMPTEGVLLVDGQPISGNRLKAWQRSIAHVPQTIYLADTTLAENIAFGVPRDAIDLDRVRQAARKAQISDFIESSPKGYQAYVGERGVRLSGGQRQRIGIARALYKKASVLVFDEATSALDTATEQSVMHAIEGLSTDITVLLIAHRITTVRRCDIIVELKLGRVAAQGTFEQLLESSTSFRGLVNAK